VVGFLHLVACLLAQTNWGCRYIHLAV
jgi:hypothetical protein